MVVDWVNEAGYVMTVEEPRREIGRENRRVTVPKGSTLGERAKLYLDCSYGGDNGRGSEERITRFVAGVREQYETRPDTLEAMIRRYVASIPGGRGWCGHTFTDYIRNIANDPAGQIKMVTDYQKEQEMEPEVIVVPQNDDVELRVFEYPITLANARTLVERFKQTGEPYLNRVLRDAGLAEWTDIKGRQHYCSTTAWRAKDPHCTTEGWINELKEQIAKAEKPVAMAFDAVPLIREAIHAERVRIAEWVIGQSGEKEWCTDGVIDFLHEAVGLDEDEARKMMQSREYCFTVSNTMYFHDVTIPDDVDLEDTRAAKLWMMRYARENPDWENQDIDEYLENNECGDH